MALAIGNFVGFETGGLEEAVTTTGTPTVSGTPTPPTGSYCLDIGLGTGNVYGIDPHLFGTDQGDGQIFGCRFRMSNGPSEGVGWTFITAAEGTTQICEVAVYRTGGVDYLRLKDNGGTTTVGTATISLNTWYVLEVYFEHVGSSGTCHVYLDGTSDITTTTGDFSAGGTYNRVLIKSSNGTQYQFDDLYTMSGASGVSDFLGEPEVYAHVVTNETTATPDYAGVATADTPSAATGGTGSPAGRWDETDDYLTSTYIIYGGGAGGGADGIALNASITEDPVAIKGLWHMKRTAGDTAVTHYGVIGNSGDGVVNTADFNPTTAYVTYFYGSESATVKPLASEEIRLGVEVVE